jgi:hypothetical protein
MADENGKPTKTESERRAWLAVKTAEIALRKKLGPVVLPPDLMQSEPANLVQIPIWQEELRGVPNSVLRSALFGAIKRGRRAFQTRVKKASIGGLLVIHTGPTLDQADLDVWMQFMHLARTSGLGNRIQYTIKGFLKAINRSTGKSQREWLLDSIARLGSSAVEIQDGKKGYQGPLLVHVFKNDLDTDSEKHVIEMNPALASLFDADGWTGLQIEERNALKRQPLAQWLHGFYSSHARPFAFKVETLHQLCGSDNKQMFSFRQELRHALDRMAEVTGWTCEVDGDDLVHVSKTGTASQQKHLIKKLSTNRGA